MRPTSRAHLAKLVRDSANANPETRCWICGQGARPGDSWVANEPARFHAIGREMVAAHRSCSSSAGGRLSHQRVHAP